MFAQEIITESWVEYTARCQQHLPHAGEIDELPTQDVEAAVGQLQTQGYCVLDARLAPAAATALADILKLRAKAGHVGESQFVKTKATGSSSTHHLAEQYGLFNCEPAVWGVTASQPEVVRLARELVGDSVRAVDAVVETATTAEATTFVAHRSATSFEIALPQASCPWLLEASWPLVSSKGQGIACEARLVPQSQMSMLPAPLSDTFEAAPEQPGALTVSVPIGAVLLTHGGLWVQRHERSSLPALDGSRLSVHVLYFAKWWNHWREPELQPLFPGTYDAMPSPVQALMPGLHARSREELYELDFVEPP
eukprot:SAG31_NODE_5888_length_2273_cov_1.429163_1_plen_309_part_10